MVSTTRGNLIPENRKNKSMDLQVCCNSCICVSGPELHSVRRQLFGFPEKSRTTLQLPDKSLTDLTERACQEWNFDFVKELPLTGRYLWQQVQAYDLPAFYSRVTPPLLKRRRVPLHQDDIQEKDSGATSSGGKENEQFMVRDECKNVVESSSKKSRLVQTSMKDFTRIQKRRSSHRLKLKQLRSRNFHRYLHRQSTATQL